MHSVGSGGLALGGVTSAGGRGGASEWWLLGVRIGQRTGRGRHKQALGVMVGIGTAGFVCLGVGLIYIYTLHVPGMSLVTFTHIL